MDHDQTLPLAAGSAGTPVATGSSVPGLVRRVRRLTRLSQRELADRLGVSQSVVARWETGRRTPSASILEQLASLAGLRLVLVAADGNPVRPMREDAARDVLGRRLPAHVEAMAARWWMPRDASTSGEGLAELRKSVRTGRAVVGYSRHPLIRFPDDRHRDDHPTLDVLRDELARGIQIWWPRAVQADDG